MVVSATDRLVPPPVCPACLSSVFRRAAGSSGGTALPQAVGLAPRMFNVSNGDTAGYEVEKILCMTASSDDTMSTGYGVITATWLQLNNGTN